MTLDRTIAPDYRIIKSIDLPNANTYKLANGNPLHIINIGDQPVLRLEIIFDAGNWFEKHPFSSHFAIKMLTEGTASKTSAQISEAFEKIGAFTEMSHTADRIGVVIYCLSRFLPEVLEMVTDLINEATFPEKELDDLKNITLQNLKVNREKTAYLATTEFRVALFGKEHPYGQFQNEKEITDLTRDQIVDHYASNIKTGKFTAILAGQISDTEIDFAKKYLSRINSSDSGAAGKHIVPDDYAGKAILVEKADSVQSSIRIGSRLFTRNHPDYFPMLVANEIFGGYFGSRLMKNIREEKGLTYGISSHMVSLSKDGYLMIGTDVKKEFTQQTIDEIHKEMYRLQTEPVSEDELQTVKNFMSGELAGSLNTAFDVADRQKIILLDNLSPDFFNQYIHEIHATSSEVIMEMAGKYLRPELMVEVVIGGK